MSILDGIRANLNDILGLRDSLGVALKPVYLVTRVWSGLEAGSGTCTETSVQILPSPKIVQFAQDERIRTGGNIESKDIILKMVSKVTFPEVESVNGISGSQNIEKLYEVGGTLYRVISVVEKHLTWQIQLRQLSDQTRY